MLLSLSEAKDVALLDVEGLVIQHVVRSQKLGMGLGLFERGKRGGCVTKEECYTSIRG